MSYQFTNPRRSVRSAVRKIAIERIDESLAVLDAGIDAAQSPDALHDLRKNVKKLRALVALVRPVFDGFRAENRSLREAGRVVSGLRDRDVALALFDRLTAGTGFDADTAANLRAAIARPLTPPPGGIAEALARHGALLRTVRKRAGHWQFEAKEFDALEPGLVRTLEAGRQAFSDWRKAHDAETLHTLRKRVKTHGYHARLLVPIWPALMGAHVEVTERLGEALGDARDHAALAVRLRGLEGGAALALRVEAEARALEALANDLAARLYSEPPLAVATRWRGWWRLWRET